MLIDVSRAALKHPTNISVLSFFFFCYHLSRVRKMGASIQRKFLMYFGSLTRDWPHTRKNRIIQRVLHSSPSFMFFSPLHRKEGMKSKKTREAKFTFSLRRPHPPRIRKSKINERPSKRMYLAIGGRKKKKVSGSSCMVGDCGVDV